MISLCGPSSLRRGPLTTARTTTERKEGTEITEKCNVTGVFGWLRLLHSLCIFSGVGATIHRDLRRVPQFLVRWQNRF